MAVDLLDEIAGLIAAVADGYRRGRRYRDISALFEERYLARALDIGTQVRRAARGGGLDADSAARSLRQLAADCESSIARVRDSDLYRRAAAAWNAGRPDEVAAAACAIFTAVERYPQCPVLYLPMALSARRRGEHFISPLACVEAIAGISRLGIEAARDPPELGADEIIRAVVLSDAADDVDSPIALEIDPAQVAVPICRVVPAGDVLLYVRRLRAPFRVSVARHVSDEWWEASPDAYRLYIADLQTELNARGIPMRERPAG